MKALLVLGLTAIGLGGCTFDQTLSELNASAPAVRTFATGLACNGTPIAITIAAGVESFAAPALVPLNGLATAGGQVACQRLSVIQ